MTKEYCSLPKSIKKYLPRFSDWFESKFGLSCKKHDNMYGKHLTWIGYYSDDVILLNEDDGTITPTRLNADNWLFRAILKQGWYFLPLACVIWTHQRLFAGGKWVKEKKIKVI